MSKPEPIDKALYNRIKNKLKQKLDVWPSAYGSSLLVKEYKAKGGRYRGKKPKKSGIKRWHNEQWINVCKLPKIVSCGRKKSSWSNYPYCRPRYRINSRTPKTAGELTKAEIKRRCSAKIKNPRKRIMPKRKSKRKSKRKPAKKSKRKR